MYDEVLSPEEGAAGVGVSADMGTERGCGKDDEVVLGEGTRGEGQEGAVRAMQGILLAGFLICASSIYLLERRESIDISLVIHCRFDYG